MNNTRYPPEGHVKLNVDGSSKSDNSTSCGVVRDSEGAFLAGFYLTKKNPQNSHLLEIKAFRQGITMVGELVKLDREECARFGKVLLFGDALRTIRSLIKENVSRRQKSTTGPLSTETFQLMEDMTEELCFEFDLQFRHDRENRVADQMCKDAHLFPDGHKFVDREDELSVKCRRLMKEDNLEPQSTIAIYFVGGYKRGENAATEGEAG
ncbi:OLC1v1018287C1 [Oldenlandia corymbosa var. corymbosa]|uniref:OLC1v1018287C1 n=1 Tax=Oldenlandia corymbosa var. corymbosa TaxID=529605 RepID=A0AAV1EB84_OLDCO|nr:OLC1v1018287C1 [Oldenlandia corymbosa var. corymbosa]